MKAYKKIMNGVAAVEKIVLSLILVFVTVITFANVVVRKLTTSQLAFTEELVINLFVGLALGTNVVIANAVGRGDADAVSRATPRMRILLSAA